MTLSAAVKKFKSKIGTSGGTVTGGPRRTADGYFYYPEGEVGYPVTVPLPGEGGRSQTVRKENETVRGGVPEERDQGQMEGLRPPLLEERRRSSINIYQSVDEDHPDLQSIQNIVANMNFSAD